MRQLKLSISDSQARFLEHYKSLGYPDKSALVRRAIEDLSTRLAKERLRASAELYAEVYAEDEELQGLTEDALRGWPE
jgi:hypothetical protein